MKTLTLFEVIAMQHFWIAESGANKPLFIRYWSKMEELIPSAWKNELMFNNIHSHIDAVFSNLASFKSEIWNKLLAQ